MRSKLHHCLPVLLLGLGLLRGTALSAADPEDTLKQAISLHGKGDIEGAIPLYQQYLKQRPGQPIALSNLGAAYARTGRYEEAIESYRAALRVQPNVPQVELNLGLAYYKSGDTDEAAKLLDKVHRAAPDQLQPAMLLADCWLAMGRNQETVDLLEPFAARHPDDRGFAYVFGMALLRLEKVERAQGYLDRILHDGDSAEAHLMIGTMKLTQRDFSGARDELARGIALKPGLPELQSYYGQTLLATGDAANAADAFRKELAANPNDFTSNLDLAVILKMDDKYDDALTHLQRALRVRPADPGVRYQIATIEVGQGKVDVARERLESLTKEVPQFTEAHVTLATIYYRLKRKEDGDRERAIVQKLLAESQAKQPGVNVK